MLYAVANETWAPGFPLTASETRTGLYRTRREADAIAAGRRLLAVAVHYDATRGVVTPSLPGDRGPTEGWSSPAVVGSTGGVTTLATIPASLVRAVGPSRLRLHPGQPAVRPPQRLGARGNHPVGRATGRG